MTFASSIDIMNRGCQHIGAQRIVSLTEDSVQASEMVFAYDKVRRAELRRNVWSFAVKQCAIRPVTTTTKLVTPSAYNSGTTYATGAVVTDTAGNWWTSLIPSNLANTPGSSTAWDAYYGPVVADDWDTTGTTGYYAGELVYVSTQVYISLVSQNTSTPSALVGWIALAATLAPLTIVYPIGAGPQSDLSSNNVYRLPANFLRRAPLDPKAGGQSYLGAPEQLLYDDWKFQGDYLISATAGVLVVRFVADVTQVPEMDDMFCEGLGARLGMETCERITQSGSKLQACHQAYKEAMGDARTVNAIEQGSDEQPADDWLSCRF